LLPGIDGRRGDPADTRAWAPPLGRIAIIGVSGKAEDEAGVAPPPAPTPFWSSL